MTSARQRHHDWTLFYPRPDPR